MSFKKWSVGCPCCQVCEVTTNTNFCGNVPGSVIGDYFINNSVIHPSSISIYMADVNSPETPTSEVFYPLVDIGSSGSHTFQYSPSNNQRLVTVANTGVWSGGPYLVTELTSCSESVTTPPFNFGLRDKMTVFGSFTSPSSLPCSYHLLQNGSQYRYYYDRSFFKQTLDQYNGSPNYPVMEYSFAGAICGYGPCLPSGQTGSPTNYGTYKVFYNPSAVTFTVNNQYPYMYSNILFYSNFQLIQSYVIYYPSGEIIPCSDYIQQEDVAQVEYEYAFVYGLSTDAYIQCKPYPLGVQVGWLNNFPVSPGYQFKGVTAFQDAENFIQNLPTTLSYGQYGASAYGSTIESFPSNPANNFIPSNPCNYTVTNSYISYDCNNNMTSGNTSLTFSAG